MTKISLNKSSDILYHLAFSHFLGIGPIKFNSLIKVFKSVKRAYLASKSELIEIIGLSLANKFCQFRASFDPVKILTNLHNKSIQIIPINHRSYPINLKNITDPPICLYIKGNYQSIINHLNQKPVIAIVGTRHPTQYGASVAKMMTKQLVEAGFITVSGMAIGIDNIIHKETILNNGQTIAVLGCGVDIVYPAINRSLYNKIVDGSGIVISEFPPGQLVLKGLFIARNRIISALSQAVLVVEGTKFSGALITAKYAADQGKDIFAIPGSITCDQSQAPHILIKNGAILTTSSQDIFDSLQIKPKSINNTISLTAKEQMVVDCLSDQWLTINEIVLKTNQSINEILNILSSLEIKRVIEKNPSGQYEVTNF